MRVGTVDGSAVEFDRWWLAVNAGGWWPAFGSLYYAVVTIDFMCGGAASVARLLLLTPGREEASSDN